METVFVEQMDFVCTSHQIYYETFMENALSKTKVI